MSVQRKMLIRQFLRALDIVEKAQPFGCGNPRIHVSGLKSGKPRVNVSLDLNKADTSSSERRMGLAELLGANLEKTKTSFGFLKLEGYIDGVKIDVYTDGCFDTSSVILVSRGKKTNVAKTCVNMNELPQYQELIRARGLEIVGGIDTEIPTPKEDS